MAIKHLKRYPKKIDKHAWWYEEAKGIGVVVQRSNQTRNLPIIPWSKIRAALARCKGAARQWILTTRVPAVIPGFTMNWMSTAGSLAGKSVMPNIVLVKNLCSQRSLNEQAHP